MGHGPHRASHPEKAKVYCAVVLDVCSRRRGRLVHRLLAHRNPGHQRAAAPVLPKGTDLVRRRPLGCRTDVNRPRKILGWKTPAEVFAGNYSPSNSPVLHRPVELAQFGSWAFATRVKQAGLVPSMGSIGDRHDNAVIASFWSRRQVELRTGDAGRPASPVANAIFDHLEIFHNRQRRHSALGWLTPRVRRPIDKHCGMKSDNPTPRKAGQTRVSGHTGGWIRLISDNGPSHTSTGLRAGRRCGRGPAAA